MTADAVPNPLPPRGRIPPAWFAACCFVIIFGIGELTVWTLDAWRGEGKWGIDLDLVMGAGSRLLAGQALYEDPKFLYPPLAALIGAPLSALPVDVVSLSYAAAKIGLVVWAVRFLAPGWPASWQALGALTVVASLPFADDLMLGNANALLVAAMVPAFFGAPRLRNGLLLGLAVAVFAKPLVAPVLLWLIVWRPRVAIGTVLAGLAATGLAVVAAGPAAYGAWAEALLAGRRLATSFAGNHGISALFPELWVPVAVACAAALTLVLLLRGPAVGLVWAVAAGILVAPYAGTYAALPMALALPVLGPTLPVLTLALVAVSPIATTHPLPFYAGLIMLAALRLPDDEGAARFRAAWRPPRARPPRAQPPGWPAPSRSSAVR